MANSLINEGHIRHGAVIICSLCLMRLASTSQGCTGLSQGDKVPPLPASAGDGIDDALSDDSELSRWDEGSAVERQGFQSDLSEWSDSECSSDQLIAAVPSPTKRGKHLSGALCALAFKFLCCAPPMHAERCTMRSWAYQSAALLQAF
jgi:hypothetical protein